MKLTDLGYNLNFEKYRTENHLDSFNVGRIISEHKERYIVHTGTAELEAEIIGNLRFTANSRSDFPAVGDWVAISEYDVNKALIHNIFPRKTIIGRQAVGKHGEKQIIATNIDYAFIVQSVDRDFNINRIERYITICNNSGVKPIIILSKTDLIDKTSLQDIVEKVQNRITNVPLVTTSNQTQTGYDKLNALIHKGETYCLLGSSGVGKSTLVNNIAGRSLMKTEAISLSTHKGRHITSHRELVVLNNGGILIDNPGMREVGIADSADGIEGTFSLISDLSSLCKYNDCKHVNESGCAVIAAVDTGDIDKSSYENYLKMEREKTHFEATVAEKHKKDKEFGKMIKYHKKSMKRNS